MSVPIGLLGFALLLSPQLDPAGRRLRWLAPRRWSSSHSEQAFTQLANQPSVAPRSGLRGWVSAWPSQLTMAAVLPALGCLLLVGPVPAALAGLSGCVATWCWRQQAAGRARQQDALALAAALAALVEEYSAGATTAAALRHSAPVAGRYRPALAAAAILAERGSDPEQALSDEPALAPLAVACRLAGGSGASFAVLLAGLRADLAADRITRDAVRAAVAGPRSSALLLAGLPVVGLAMGAGMGADPGRVLLRTPAGLAVLTAGVLLDLTGLVWTAVLTGRASR